MGIIIGPRGLNEKMSVKCLEELALEKELNKNEQLMLGGQEKTLASVYEGCYLHIII